MMSFDGNMNGSQQGNPQMQRPNQPGPPMQQMHHPQMNVPPHYGHRPNGNMGGMPGPGPGPPGPVQPQGFQMPPSPVNNRQNGYGNVPPNNGQYSSHAPLHPPPLQQQQGMHPSMPQRSPHQPNMHSNSMGRRNPSTGMGMPPGMPPQHDPMRTSQGTHSRHQNQPPQQQPVPPPQQQQYMAGGGGGGPNNNGAMNGSWQSDNDTPHRREMIQHILKLLKKDKNGSPDSMTKLPQMAKQLEVSLYRNARSFNAYMDMSTLKQRLQQIAMEVSRKARGNSSGNSANNGDVSQRDNRMYDGSDRMSFSQNGMQRSDRGMSSSSNGVAVGSNNTAPSASSSFMGNSSSGGNRMVNMDDINPMANSNGGGGDMMRGSSSSGYTGSRAPPQQQQMNMQQQQPPQQQQMNRSSSQRQGAASGNSGSGGGRSNDPEWKIRIKHKQQRLLLLHHSAKCLAEDGQCTVTPHCSDMKRLWRHMEGCKDNNCRIPHCFSSRAILSHYRKCKEPGCPACGPVRDTVRRSRSSPSSATSRAAQGNSTGPMMNAMRGMGQSVPPVAPPQGNPPSQGVMPNVADPMSSSVNSYGANASSASGQFPSSGGSIASSQMAMPPPPSGGNGQGGSFPTPSSNQWNSSNGRPSSSSGSSVQPLYGSDRPPSASSSSRPADASSSGQMPAVASSRSGGSGNSMNGNDSQWHKIRHKQQRLLLLRHASRCKYEAGQCPVTPHCASMKKLWKHIANCKNQKCAVQHCLSSRYVLSHYRRCKDSRCPACGPVRETIRQSHDRDRQGDQPSSADQLLQQDDSFGRVGGSVASPTPPSSSAIVSSSSQNEPNKRAKMEHNRPPPETSSRPQGAAPVRPDRPKSGKGPGDKASVDHSLLESFTVLQLETHLKSLERKTQLAPAKLKTKGLEVIKGLQSHNHGWVFNTPVDPVELGLPDYFEIIKKPMDLGSIQKRLESGAYHALEDFTADVYLTFENAMAYNESGSVVYDMAKQLCEKAKVDFAKLMSQLEDEDRERRRNERACTLCGCEKLLFEPPVYFCNGMNCQSQRIRRNSHFYIGGTNQYFWCSSCFNELDDKIPIELVDMTIMKGDLKKKKNDEVHEESWVQCDTCERWVHQICGLFNTRQNKEHHSEYCCPQCLLEKRKSIAITPSPRPLMAADLPRTTLSEWLEESVTQKVENRKKELARERAESENISLEESLRDVEAGGPIIIRQVTAMDRKLEVRERMRARYAHKNYPEEFPFRCKCIVVFQHLDGVDVVLFALYLYEHGEDNPLPNKRCVYVSYLDSVHFMKPRRLRTFVYHEILIAYLDYARRRGYSTAHIWACPPLKGDDYIFYAKPEDQKTPRDSRLRQWYIDMLIESQKRSIVGKVTNMYDLYFADPNIDATSVPYLEGDYFPGEAENIIKVLEEGGGKKGGSKKKKSKANKSQKSKGGNTGTRATGIDEEALLASGYLDGTKNLKDLDRDQVMVKLGETIQPMKDSFIVAFLNWKGAKDENMVVPEEIEKAREEYAAKGDPDLVGSKRDALGSVKDAKPKTGKDGEPLKVIDDDQEDLDCEFLNNRQAFLNLCRGNHYQFDELRRAKHTSLMVLWHLHNRDAPKFVQQCVSCSREILSGKRFHCNSCQDYDLCQDCFKDPKANRGNCTHTLVPIAVEPDAGKERSGLTEQQRLQRQRNLMLHIQLIEHASRCSSQGCTSTNCAKMKKYLQHARVCKVKIQGGCKICKRIWTLLRIHAQKCKDSNCPIPQCNAIREKMRQLQKQQQAMDDRRRLEMNRHMRFSMAGGG